MKRDERIVKERKGDEGERKDERKKEEIGSEPSEL